MEVTATQGSHSPCAAQAHSSARLCSPALQGCGNWGTPSPLPPPLLPPPPWDPLSHMAEVCWLSDGGRVIAQWQLCPRLGPARGAPMRRKKWGWGSSGAAVLRLLPCLSGVPCFSGVPAHVVLQDSRGEQ